MTPLVSRIGRALKWRWRRFFEDTVVDMYFGVETGLVEQDYLNDVDSENRGDLEFYEAIKWRSFKSMTEKLPAILDLRDFVFIDAGCGKGRALIFASKYKYRKAIGIEISEKLANIARRNIASFREKHKCDTMFEIHSTDILNFTLPDENIVLFLYNPFKGDVMNAFLDRVRHHGTMHGRNIYILYRNPVCHEMFIERNDFEVLHHEAQEHAVYKYLPAKTVLA